MQMNLSSVVLISLMAVIQGCQQVAPPAPVGPLPSERQLAWHELEFYAFVHFSMNTFTNMEWGTGSEKPEQFNPTALDTRQWAKVCRDAGMKGIILTAKHHDGFCLWPSAYTEHSVKNSPWKEGKGDVVRELADACKEYGLKMGLYLSPWDRNHADYGRPEYITYYRNQLRELLTNYGEIFEVWFDGANGGTGCYGGTNEERRIDPITYYDWENTFKIVRKLQPNAAIFSDGGPDVRWVGNEEGWARPTNWSLLKQDIFGPGLIDDIEHQRAGQEDGTHWIPAEVDVSIRPGWFYHPYEDHRVKSLTRLLDIYYNSVGRNANFLLNLPVDTRGLIHEKDVEQIMKLTAALRADFAVNLASGKPVSASNVRGCSRKYRAENATDNNTKTYWATDDNVKQAEWMIEFSHPETFNRIWIQEYIPLGQRVKKFRVEAFSGNSWKTIAEETTIGCKRILRLPTTEATKLKLIIEDAKASPLIADIQIFNAPKILEPPAITRNRDGIVSILASDNETTLYYTADNSEPSDKAQKYDTPFLLDRKATVKAIAVDPLTGLASPVSCVKFDISSSKWKLIGEWGKLAQANALFDGDPGTALVVPVQIPDEVVIDLGEMVNLGGFAYLPVQGRGNAGLITRYECNVSLDNRQWGKPVVWGEFANIVNSPVLQKVTITPVKARYIKLKALSVADVNPQIGIAEIEIVTADEMK